MSDLQKGILQTFLMILMTAPLGALLLFSQINETQITCERPVSGFGTCKIVKSGWRGKTKTQKVPIGIVKGAEIKTDPIKSLINDGLTVKKLVLKTWLNEIYIADNQYSLNRRTISAIANKINTFLEDKTQNKLTIKYGNWIEIIISEIVFAFFDIWFIVVLFVFL